MYNIHFLSPFCMYHAEISLFSKSVQLFLKVWLLPLFCFHLDVKISSAFKLFLIFKTVRNTSVYSVLSEKHVNPCFFKRIIEVYPKKEQLDLQIESTVFSLLTILSPAYDLAKKAKNRRVKRKVKNKQLNINVVIVPFHPFIYLCFIVT